MDSSALHKERVVSTINGLYSAIALLPNHKPIVTIGGEDYDTDIGQYLTVYEGKKNIFIGYCDKLEVVKDLADNYER